MRQRQVHRDFHACALIPGIGSRFDAEAFGTAFKDAHVDSVTIFSKCHHGRSYHPTRVGKTHPHLGFDLLRAQFDALRAKGINARIYLTATWDELAAFEYPNGAPSRQTAACRAMAPTPTGRMGFSRFFLTLSRLSVRPNGRSYGKLLGRRRHLHGHQHAIAIGLDPCPA
jgi:Hypothetical glycosyl hydrolase 6